MTGSCESLAATIPAAVSNFYETGYPLWLDGHKYAAFLNRSACSANNKARIKAKSKKLSPHHISMTLSCGRGSIRPFSMQLAIQAASHRGLKIIENYTAATCNIFNQRVVYVLYPTNIATMRYNSASPVVTTAGTLMVSGRRGKEVTVQIVYHFACKNEIYQHKSILSLANVVSVDAMLCVLHRSH